IISIDNNDIKTMSTENISRALLGEVGTKISLVYRRDGVDTPVDLIRTDIKIPVVELKMIEDNAVIKISEFNDVTYEQFKECVDTAVQNGAKGFIFDVRNNTGGTINSVIKVLDMILPSGEIAKKIDNNGVETVLGTSDRFEIEAPIVTLVNGKTASAAELFVACIRDFEKGNSVGTKTYGKGVIQSLIKLTDGSAINITTAHFLPPSNQEINNVGIIPDYEVPFEGDLSSIEYTDDVQLLKAIEVVNTKK
ncbi:MAG: S41 family peptidase, partial [Oscillospiraceae bacterium]